MNVEIEIPIAELKAKLPGLAKIVPRSSNLPILQCIKVSLQQNSIALQAHNLDEVATVTLPNQANGLSGELLVPMEILTKIVKGCASDQSVRLISNKEETKIRYMVAGSAVDRLVHSFFADGLARGEEDPRTRNQSGRQLQTGITGGPGMQQC